MGGVKIEELGSVVWYCNHSQVNLVVGMVIRCVPLWS
jgi:hypothetical protein